MLPKLFKPENTYDLIRLGQNNDGGYLLQKNSLMDAKSLISFGLSYDWTFEKDFFKVKNCPIHCYDPAVKYSNVKKFSRKNIINSFNLKNLFNKDLILDFIKKFNLWFFSWKISTILV
mgnify:CR=1 FL=1